MFEKNLETLYLIQKILIGLFPSPELIILKAYWRSFLELFELSSKLVLALLDLFVSYNNQIVEDCWARLKLYVLTQQC